MTCFVNNKYPKMKLCSACLTLALFTSSWCAGSALPPKEHKDRVHDLPLSEKEHVVDGDHNSDYDHDAFLGEDADEFNDLAPEESLERLGTLVGKIDKSGDGFVTEEELIDWIKYVQRKYVLDDSDKMWEEHEKEANGALKWESYRERTYGYKYEPEDSDDFKDMVERDLRKWNAADEDKDGSLTKEEFTSFLHPEEVEHMKDIVVLETIEDIDKDKDGHISLEEYIGDMWQGENGDEPDWVKNEREQFSQFRDKNGDGKMDHEEVKDWIIPPNYDHSEAESKHLIYECDVDKDGMLTKQEILDHHDIFVGSQATEFGDALLRHDEF